MVTFPKLRGTPNRHSNTHLCEILRTFPKPEHINNPWGTQPATPRVWHRRRSLGVALPTQVAAPLSRVAGLLFEGAGREDRGTQGFAILCDSLLHQLASGDLPVQRANRYRGRVG